MSSPVRARVDWSNVGIDDVPAISSTTMNVMMNWSSMRSWSRLTRCVTRDVWLPAYTYRPEFLFDNAQRDDVKRVASGTEREKRMLPEKWL